MVECQLPKLEVAGSSPVARSSFLKEKPHSAFPQRILSHVLSHKIDPLYSWSTVSGNIVDNSKISHV